MGTYQAVRKDWKEYQANNYARLNRANPVGTKSIDLNLTVNCHHSTHVAGVSLMQVFLRIPGRLGPTCVRHVLDAERISAQA